MCSVCYEPILQLNLPIGLFDTCDHVYCFPCAEKWAQNARFKSEEIQCPTCRARVMNVIKSYCFPYNQKSKD